VRPFRCEEDHGGKAHDDSATVLVDALPHRCGDELPAFAVQSIPGGSFWRGMISAPRSFPSALVQWASRNCSWGGLDSFGGRSTSSLLEALVWGDQQNCV